MCGRRIAHAVRQEEVGHLIDPGADFLAAVGTKRAYGTTSTSARLRQARSSGAAKIRRLPIATGTELLASARM
jgi:hypothetical protein